MVVAANSQDATARWLGPTQAHSVPGSDAEKIGLSDIIAIVRRRLVVGCVTILGCTVAATILAFSLPNLYTATSTLVLERNDTQLFEVVEALESQQTDRSAIETEIDIIRSRIFTGRVVDSFDLVRDPRFNTYLPAADEISSDSEVLPSEIAQRDRTISTLLSRFSVTQSGQSLAVSVRVSSEDPRQAAALANGIANLYVSWSLELKRDATLNTVDFLRTRAQTLGSRIAEQERQIAEYSRDNHLVSDSRDDLLRGQMQQLNVQVTASRVEQAESEARLEQVQRLLTGGTEVAGTVLTSALLGTLRDEAARLVRERAELALDFGRLHPRVRNLDAEIASVREMIGEEIQRIVLDLENEVRIAATRVAEIESELAAQEEGLRTRGVAEIRLRELERDLLAAQRRYDEVLERLGNLDRQVDVLKPSARVVSLAETPTEPSAPRRKIIVGGGFLGSTVLAIILMLVLEGMDTRIRSSARILQLLQIPHLADVPKIPRKWWRRTPQPYRYVKQRPQSAFAEAIRSLYVACRLSNGDCPPKVIMFTSCLPAEGKTSLSVSLAATAAIDGRRTIVLDLDLRQCGVLKALGVKANGASLDQFLRGDCPLTDAIQKCPDQPGLDFIAATRRPSNPTTLLSSDRLPKMLETLRTQYDLVVIDTPPMLAVSDANWLLPFVDTAILVVRWGKTKEDALRATANRLPLNRPTLIGTVINEVEPHLQARHGYGGALTYNKHSQKYYLN